MVPVEPSSSQPVVPRAPPAPQSTGDGLSSSAPPPIHNYTHGREPVMADGGDFTIYTVENDFTPKGLFENIPLGKIIGWAVFEVHEGAQGSRFVCHWQAGETRRDRLTLERNFLERNRRRPKNFRRRWLQDPLLGIAHLPGRLIRWLQGLGPKEAVGVIIAVATTSIGIFTSYNVLRSFYLRARHVPLDVSVRAVKSEENVQLGKPFTVRMAVENYTDWHQPYVRLNATLVHDGDGRSMEARVDPPDIAGLDANGRVYVEVSALVTEPGRYTLKMDSFPLYERPASTERRAAWAHFISHEHSNGEPSDARMLIIAHADQEFADRRIVKESPDSMHCYMTVTLTTGTPYPYGLRITANTPQKSYVFFHDVTPAVGDQVEFSSSTDDAAIVNGAFVRWQSEKMDALENRTFALYLQSRHPLNHDGWEQVVQGIIFSVESLREPKKP